LRRLDPEEATTGKRGFFQRINPVNLFRSEKPNPPTKPPAEIVTPLPSDTSKSAPPSAAAASAKPPTPVAGGNRSEVTTIPGPPSAPRYQYGRIKQPVAGDRAAAERLFERGVGAQTRRDPSTAASFFSAAIAADATYFPAHYNLGLAGYASGQWFSALSAFETALVLDRNSAEARYNFALALQKARFSIDSAKELERLLEQKPDDTRAMLLLGNVYAQDLENEEGARKMYQRLLAKEPQHPQATAIRYWLAEHP
jgi:tetratricopeptide (TPR) repeat protein